MSVQISESKVGFRALDGEVYSFAGIKYQVAAVASPLVEDGSGQGLGHPQVSKKKAVKSTVSAVVPALRGTEEEVTKSITVAPKGTKLAYGDAVIYQASLLSKEGRLVIEKWNSLIPGKVIGEANLRFNENNRTLAVSVDCLQIETSDAEKYRGFAKYRSNGGFLRNIKIIDQKSGELIFDPNTSLKDDKGNYLQAEHVLGAEEFKTFMFAAGIVANDLLGEVIWDAKTGKWENEEALIKATEASARRVKVVRSNYQADAYQMFKDMYEGHPDFVFDDSTNSITHSNVYCWYGQQAEIVEVPLTKTFMGRCPLFAEHIAYLGTEFPELYKVLLEEVKVNQERIQCALDLAQGEIPNSTDENPYGNCAVIDDQTLVETGEKFKITLVESEGVHVVDTITIPEGTEYDAKLIRKIHKKLSKHYDGVVIESIDAEGFTYAVPLDLETFTLVTGTVSHEAFVTLARIFHQLEIDSEDRSYDNWSGNFYRLTRMLAGSLEFLVADSNALLAKATKTGPIAFTCRAASTLDACVELDEIHFHPEHIKFWGLEEGDFFLIGRVPVPGLGVLRVVSNELVPFGTGVMNAGRKHEVEEGDVDGDSLIGIAFSKEGILRKPGANLEVVNFLQD